MDEKEHSVSTNSKKVNNIDNRQNNSTCKFSGEQYCKRSNCGNKCEQSLLKQLLEDEKIDE